MARADASPKAIIKAAIRTKCHVVAAKYPDMRLDQLHGSNVRWLVLFDELFREVCADFTIRKLHMDQSQIRTIFESVWVAQVTYELITKPCRMNRKISPSTSSTISSSPPSPLQLDNTDARTTNGYFYVGDRAVDLPLQRIQSRGSDNDYSYSSGATSSGDSTLPWQQPHFARTDGLQSEAAYQNTTEMRGVSQTSSSINMMATGTGRNADCMQQHWLSVVLN